MKAIPENKKDLNETALPGKKKKHIKYFDSFSAMDEADAKEMAALSPLEHFQNVVLLTEKIFAEELKKPRDKKIKFK